VINSPKAILISQFLRERAWWRLDSAGASPVHVGRSVVSLLDAAAYLQDVPDHDPQIRALSAAGCFRGGTFDPGPAGAAIIREWQLADKTTAGPAELLTALADAARSLPMRPIPGVPAQMPAPMPSRSVAAFN
jgi:hypothetical protein